MLFIFLAEAHILTGFHGSSLHSCVLALRAGFEGAVKSVA